MKDALDQKIPIRFICQRARCQRPGIMWRADMKNKPAPLLNPGTLEPMTAEELSAVFCEELVAQESEQ